MIPHFPKMETRVQPTMAILQALSFSPVISYQLSPPRQRTQLSESLSFIRLKVKNVLLLPYSGPGFALRQRRPEGVRGSRKGSQRTSID